MTFKRAAFQDSLSEENLSWKAGVNWRVDPRKLLYATVSKGYKNGLFITTGATFAAQLAPATQESVVAFEAGFKFGLLGRSLQLNGAAFYYDYKDEQIRGRVIDPVLGGLNRLINIPRSRIAGAELQLIWEPTEGIVFNSGATYVGSKIKGDFTNFTPLGTEKVMAGEAFPLTPKWQLTGDAQYDFPVNENFNAFLGTSATYQSSTNAALGEEPLFDVKAYTLVDLRFGVHAQGRCLAHLRLRAQPGQHVLLEQRGVQRSGRGNALRRSSPDIRRHRYFPLPLSGYGNTPSQ